MHLKNLSVVLEMVYETKTYTENLLIINEDYSISQGIYFSLYCIMPFNNEYFDFFLPQNESSLINTVLALLLVIIQASLEIANQQSP